MAEKEKEEEEGEEAIALIESVSLGPSSVS